MRIYTFNGQEIANESRFFELEEALGKIKYDVFGISETRMVGEIFLVFIANQSPEQAGFLRGRSAIDCFYYQPTDKKNK